MTTMHAELNYDLLRIADPGGDHNGCGVSLNYRTDATAQAKLGLDPDGNPTFSSAEISVDIERDRAIESVRQFIVDSYCAYDCTLGNPPAPANLMVPAAGCDAAANGHQAACDAGTLAFQDVPAGCDTLIGEGTKIPARLVLWILALLPDANNAVTFRFSGWGHRMTLVDDPDELKDDWTMIDWVWGTCPLLPP